MLPSDIKPSRTYSDPYFQVSDDTAKFLSIQIGIDALYFSVLDIKSNSYLLLVEYIFEDVHNETQLLDECEKIFASEEILKQDFQKAVIGIIGGASVLIPEALFDPNKTKEYLNFSQDVGMDLYVDSDSLINVRARNVFGVSQSIYDLVKSSIPNATIMHASSPLIESLSLQLRHDKGNKVILHIQYSHFEMLYFKNGMLQFYNSFNYTTGEDLIYYVLFVFEQLNLNQEEESLLIFGEMEEFGHVADLLKQYIYHVEFGNRSDMIKFSQVLDTVPKHYYFNLFHQFLCA